MKRCCYSIAALLISLAIVAPAFGQSAAGLTFHIVRKGETWQSIAADVGISEQTLRRLNGGDEAELSAGRRLLVPLLETVLEYRVQAGDTLYGIARQFGVSATDIAAWNDMQIEDFIYVGQFLRLRLPASGGAADDEGNELALSPFTFIHSVRSGESLSSIAERYQLPLARLIAANDISDPSLVYAGAELRIPGWEVPLAPQGLPVLVEAVDLRPTPLREGQTARLWLRTVFSARLEIEFQDEFLPVHTSENGREHIVLLRVPVNSKPALIELNLTVARGESAPQSFQLQTQILPGNFGLEQITLPPGLLSLLDGQLEQAEAERVRSVYSRVSAWRQFGGGMQAPAAAAISSPFGVRRSYNGGAADRFHSGVDFLAAVGSPIYASAPGVVVLAERLEIRGLATIIDHGWGVFTGYWHQSSQTVSVGQSVSAGQIIGMVGGTGRVSGYHLHWELWVNGAPVDPLQWIEVAFP